MIASGSIKKYWIRSAKIILYSIIVFTEGNVLAAQATFSWKQNSESDLAGYRIHYGTASRSYSVHIDVGNVTRYTVLDLTAGFTYFFAVTAYDTEGYESGYSNEAIFSTDQYDLDLDGDVDGSDLADFIAAHTDYFVEADLNLDSIIDDSDTALFVKQYGSSY